MMLKYGAGILTQMRSGTPMEISNTIDPRTMLEPLKHIVPDYGILFQLYNMPTL